MEDIESVRLFESMTYGDLFALVEEMVSRR